MDGTVPPARPYSAVRSSGVTVTVRRLSFMVSGINTMIAIKTFNMTLRVFTFSMKINIY